jgi:hypothetical protein
MPCLLVPHRLLNIGLTNRERGPWWAFFCVFLAAGNAFAQAATAGANGIRRLTMPLVLDGKMSRAVLCRRSARFEAIVVLVLCCLLN